MPWCGTMTWENLIAKMGTACAARAGTRRTSCPRKIDTFRAESAASA